MTPWAPTTGPGRTLASQLCGRASRPATSTWRVSPAELRQQLAPADKNQDGKLKMEEARDFLIKNSIVRQDGEADNVKIALEYAFGALPGVPVSPGARSGDRRPAHVCYVQLNNAANSQLQEEKDLRTVVGGDPDAPKLDVLNWTREFNTNGDRDAATSAIKRNLTAYLDRILGAGERLTGFVLSGHSNGTQMLQETSEHYYHGNLAPRELLRELCATAKYRKAFDEVEKVGLLACFHGGALAEWAEIFPNACIAGTRQFAPNSHSPASGEIFARADAAHDVLEAGGTTTSAKQKQHEGPYRRFLNEERGLELRVPEGAAAATRAAEAVLAQAKQFFDYQRAQIGTIVSAGGAAVAQGVLDAAYEVANKYYLARNDLFVASNGRGGDAEAEVIARLDFLRKDLFAIRKHYTDRPSRPSGCPATFWQTV
jgi:hypothetical protein